jgi:opacity protein-like surface antigen
MMRFLAVAASLAAFAVAAAPASALNPQPLPPKVYKEQYVSKYNWVLLNPQPLPPKYRNRFGR